LPDASREKTFATSWYLGEVALRLGVLEAGLDALRDAHEADPEHPDDCRELCAPTSNSTVPTTPSPSPSAPSLSAPTSPASARTSPLLLLLTGDVDGATEHVAKAHDTDPDDPITRALKAMIDDVHAGRRRRARTLAEAEGR